MRALLRLALLSAVLTAAPAIAQDVTTSPRPQARPNAAAAEPSPVAQPAPGAAAAEASASTGQTPPRPRHRPAGTSQQAIPTAAAEPLTTATAPILRPRARPDIAPLPPQPAAVAVTVASAMTTIRPMPRPPGLSAAPRQPEAVASASAAAPQPERRGGLFGGLFGRREQGQKATPADGYVCGDPDIRGEELAPVTSRIRGCGIPEPVRVTSVDGIRLTTAATIDCTTARALKTWINEGMRPAFGRPEVVELRIAASYICRPRNNVRGAKISEHGRGKAIDISGFILSNGRELSVSGDYNRMMRRAQKAACGIFGTTLGPGSDGYHEDHLHFDTSNMDRPYCR
ncbi:MAG: extensin family protein [Rhodobacter sp. CACIA14H1]|nr:MAG: extensin family protein [Rhodobacter sp. CACIA14H1]